MSHDITVTSTQLDTPKHMMNMCVLYDGAAAAAITADNEPCVQLSSTSGSNCHLFPLECHCCQHGKLQPCKLCKSNLSAGPVFVFAAVSAESHLQRGPGGGPLPHIKEGGRQRPGESCTSQLFLCKRPRSSHRFIHKERAEVSSLPLIRLLIDHPD